MSILSNRTDVDAMTALKLEFNAVGLKGINTSTVKILREENNRNLEHWGHNSQRYHRMKMETEIDAMMMVFPTDNTLLHCLVSCVAIRQDQRKPNRWVNKITQELIDVGITSIEELESKINDDTLNECLDNHGMPRLHDITVRGFTQMLGTQDFCQGRSRSIALSTVRHWMDKVHLWRNLPSMVPLHCRYTASRYISAMLQSYVHSFCYTLQQMV
jgi:hypothetical protein